MFSRKMYEEGEITAGIMTIGQGLGLSEDIPTVKELIERVVKQAEEIIQKQKSTLS